MTIAEINHALDTSGAGDAYVLIVLILMVFWSGVVVAGTVISYLWVRETWRRFASHFEADDEDFDAGPTPIGYTAPHTDEMGYVEYVDEPIEERS